VYSSLVSSAPTHQIRSWEVGGYRPRPTQSAHTSLWLLVGEIPQNLPTPLLHRTYTRILTRPKSVSMKHPNGRRVSDVPLRQHAVSTSSDPGRTNTIWATFDDGRSQSHTATRMALALLRIRTGAFGRLVGRIRDKDLEIRVAGVHLEHTCSKRGGQEGRDSEVGNLTTRRDGTR
jgi:hypothetical protein